MNKIERKDAHAFFDSLIAGESPEEKIAILRDILVDEFCFNGMPEEVSELEAAVYAVMSSPQGASQKIQQIKLVREKTGLGLKEAKEFVESLTPGHPYYGQKQYRQIDRLLPTPQDYTDTALVNRLNKIARAYNRPGICFTNA